ncbi:MAG: 16S rRNA (adenine(1518)-N(6)/adenine(1519)-N(6))-dimethyltransferase RsmA [Actinobacteria bacterium]|nr:16S rRNA (adenine(1518)-N(6)/adenine(1519)-N(6))-dimethyltransferase RsmA [Actinomycetota bacterium]
MPIVHPAVTKEILKKYNIKLSKSLGQNFLIDQNTLKKIVNAAELSKDDVILEVGPGIGALTESLAEQAKKVIAIEYDRNLLRVLKDVFVDFKNIDLIYADALKYDFSQLNGENQPNKVVSNLPYNIAAPLVLKILENVPQIKEFIIMVQKEVGDRMAAVPCTKDYGILSLKIQYFSEVKFLFNVSRKVFLPQPNVDSIVLRVNRCEKPKILVENQDFFFKLINIVFSQRRKTLKNVIFDGFKVSAEGKETVLEAFSKAQIDSARRAETLDLSEFGRLSDSLAKTLKP